MRLYCGICKKIQHFGKVGKIEGRPLIVFECDGCNDLQIQTEEMVTYIENMSGNK